MQGSTPCICHNTLALTRQNIMNNTPHFHLLTVKYIGPTNSRGSRVKISSDRFEDSKTIPYDHSFNGALAQGHAWAQSHGFNLIGTAEGKRVDYLMTDTFKGLRETR